MAYAYAGACSGRLRSTEAGSTKRVDQTYPIKQERATLEHPAKAKSCDQAV